MLLLKEWFLLHSYYIATCGVSLVVFWAPEEVESHQVAISAMCDIIVLTATEAKSEKVNCYIIMWYTEFSTGIPKEKLKCFTYMYKGKLVFFQDVIKIGQKVLKQKGKFLHVVQPTMDSTLGVYDIHPR